MDMHNLEEYTGAIKDDPRSPEEKARDYSHEEVLGAGATFEWKEKAWSDLLHFPFRDQDGSGSCGAQSGAKAITALVEKAMSAAPIFRNRTNYPSTGMFLKDIGANLLHIGTCLESLAPSLQKNDAQIDATAYPETPFKVSGYYFLPCGTSCNIDLLAEALEKGHPLVIGISTNYKDWVDVPVISKEATSINHFVCAVPKNYLMRDGKKTILIDDSFALNTTYNQTGQRFLTEEFLKAQSWGIMALIPFTETKKPKYHFEKVLEYGMTGTEVVKLQDMLIWENFLQPGFNTGKFRILTATALRDWQIAHGITDFADEKDLTKIRFGNKSIKVGNSIYGTK